MLSYLSACSGFLHLYQRAFSFLTAYVQILVSSSKIAILVVDGGRDLNYDTGLNSRLNHGYRLVTARIKTKTQSCSIFY
jgi:hypothetical protein